MQLLPASTLGGTPPSTLGGGPTVDALQIAAGPAVHDAELPHSELTVPVHSVSLVQSE